MTLKPQFTGGAKMTIYGTPHLATDAKAIRIAIFKVHHYGFDQAIIR